MQGFQVPIAGRRGERMNRNGSGGNDTAFPTRHGLGVPAPINLSDWNRPPSHGQRVSPPTDHNERNWPHSLPPPPANQSVPIARTGADSMNRNGSGGNNTSFPTQNWPPSHRIGFPASTNHNDWNRPQSHGQSFPPPTFHSEQNGTQSRPPPPVNLSNERGGMQDHPWMLLEETVRPGPHGIIGFPSERHSPVRILVLEDGLVPRGNLRPQEVAPPRIGGQRNMGFVPQQEEPGLSQHELKKAMSKLRKHIFSPAYPRKSAWKRGLFSRSEVNVEEEEDDDEGRECTICLDAFVPNQQVVLTPCNHMFHEECVVPWVKSHGQCPLCRYAFVERRPNVFPRNTNNTTGEGRVMDIMSLIRVMDIMSLITTGEGRVMDIMSLIRAMEEAFEWMNVAR